MSGDLRTPPGPGPAIAYRANAAGDYPVRRQAGGVVIGTVTPIRRYAWLAQCNCGGIVGAEHYDRIDAAAALSRHFEGAHG